MIVDILIADKDVENCAKLKEILQNTNYTTRLATTYQELLQEIRVRLPSLILLSLTLPSLANLTETLEFVQRMIAKYPYQPIILMGSGDSISFMYDAIEFKQSLGIDFLFKPIHTKSLLYAIAKGLYYRKKSLAAKMEKNWFALSYQGILLGNSLATQEFTQNLIQATKSKSRILISGAEGAEKIVAAYYLHQHSSRRDNPLILLSCSMIASENFEEILFGSEDPNCEFPKIGLLEQAHGGSLLFHTIEAMPIAVQMKMRRILQQNQFQRLGGNQNIPIDVRMITVTGFYVEDMVAKGRIDEDFYNRISVLKIIVPSLAQRRSDIGDLIVFFSQQHAHNYSMPEIIISEAAMAVLKNKNWAGNAVELNNFVERLYLQDTHILSQMVTKSMVNNLLSDHEERYENDYRLTNLFLQSWRFAKENFQKHYLQYQLQRYGSNVSQIAREIGMDRAALHRRIKDLKLNVAEETFE